MAYDSHFIPGVEIPLPILGQRVRAVAFDDGRPVDHSRFSIIFNQVRRLAICTAHNIDGATIIPEGVIDQTISASIQRCPMNSR